MFEIYEGRIQNYFLVTKNCDTFSKTERINRTHLTAVVHVFKATKNLKDCGLTNTDNRNRPRFRN